MYAAGKHIPPHAPVCGKEDVGRREKLSRKTAGRAEENDGRKKYDARGKENTAKGI